VGTFLRHSVFAINLIE